MKLYSEILFLHKYSPINEPDHSNNFIFFNHGVIKIKINSEIFILFILFSVFISEEMYKIMQKAPTNQHQNIKKNSPPSPQKYIQAYIIDYGKIIGKGNFSTVYSAINKNKPA